MAHQQPPKSGKVRLPPPSNPNGGDFMPFPASAQAKIQAAQTARGAAAPGANVGPRVRNLSVQTAGSPSAPQALAPMIARPPSVAQGTQQPQPKAVENPGFTAPTSEAEAVSISLCSRFAYYPFKDLYARPFRVKHLAKLHKAHEDSSLLHTVEAVSSVLSTSAGTPNVAFDLCVADFYHVLYWLRLHSFTKNHILHKTMCDDPKHREQVALGNQPVESLNLSRMVTETDLEVIELEELPDADAFALEAEGWFLRPATMRDLLEFSEDPSWLDAEFQYMARQASQLAYQDEAGQVIQVPLRQRIALLEDWAPSELVKVMKFEKLIDRIGVNETVVMTCGCGASKRSKIQLDAHSFLSALEQE